MILGSRRIGVTSLTFQGHVTSSVTLHTAISGVNSKRFVLMLLPGLNETFVNCAI